MQYAEPCSHSILSYSIPELF